MSSPDTNDPAVKSGGKGAGRVRSLSEGELEITAALSSYRRPSSGSLSGRTSIPQKHSYFTSEIDLGLFDGFMVLEAEHNLLTDPQKAILEQIKKDRDFHEVFLSASSCRRHVYIFRRSDLLKQSTIPGLQELAKSTSTEDNLRVYLKTDALKFLMLWVSGSLNEGKYRNDTYNRKTVNTCVDLFKNFLQMIGVTSGNPEAFGKEFGKLQNTLDNEIKALRKEAAQNFEEKIKWLETKKEQANRMKEFRFLRITPDSKPDEFLLDLKSAFVVVNKLCSVFERIKQLPAIKELWSDAIKKETLDIIKQEDRDLFSDIMKCRKDFIEFTCDVLLEDLRNRTATIDEVNGRITERFAPAVKELSLVARKIISSEKLSPDLPASPLVRAAEASEVAEVVYGPHYAELASINGDATTTTNSLNPVDAAKVIAPGTLTHQANS